MFNLTTIENEPALKNSHIESEHILDLSQTIEENLPLAIAIGTEKARSEMLIAPILIKIRKLLKKEVSLFSGTEFNIDRELGLVGICDYLFSLSPEQYAVEAPVLVLVEAKLADLNTGMGQVVAEMIAAQRFNRQQQKQISCIYGCITSGTQWRFLKLCDRNLTIDPVDRNLEPLEVLVGSILQVFYNYIN